MLCCPVFIFLIMKKNNFKKPNIEELINNHNCLFTAYSDSKGNILTELSFSIDLSEILNEKEQNEITDKIGIGLTELITNQEKIQKLLFANNCLFADFMLLGFSFTDEKSIPKPFRKVTLSVNPGQIIIIPVKKNENKESINDHLINKFQYGRN